MLHVLATHQHIARRLSAHGHVIAAAPRKGEYSPDRIFSKRGTGRLACADNCQDYICSRVALTRTTRHDIVAHFLIRPRSVPSTRLSSQGTVPPARFFDVKWLATESVLLMSSYWLLSSPIQLALFVPGATAQRRKIRVGCGTVALTTRQSITLRICTLFNFAFDTNSKASRLLTCGSVKGVLHAAMRAPHTR
jgi:hypothetical protein